MARGVRRRLAADYSVATTGIAGPTGATAAKPLGLSVTAAAGPRNSASDVRVHPGGRSEVKAAATQQALSTLEALLRREGIL